MIPGEVSLPFHCFCPCSISYAVRPGSFLLTRDSDDGYNKPSLIPYVPTGTLQVPSNVTRIARALKRIGLDGTPQIIYVSVAEQDISHAGRALTPFL
jgi:hypothetical protein